MLFWKIVKVAFKSLISNKLRSFLAMLGIIIGVAAVISMLALGAGTREKVMKRIASLGTNLLIVRPGQRGVRGVMTGTHKNLTLADAKAILETKGVAQVAPLVRGGAHTKYFNKNTKTSIIGSSITYFSIRNYPIEKGRCFNEWEIKNRAKVAILGATVVENLFEKTDPINKFIKINKINFKVIGVLKAKGDRGHYNPDNRITIPYTTAMKQVFGVTKLHEIDIQVSQANLIQTTLERIRQVLRKRHKLLPETPDDFYIRNIAEYINMASDFSNTFTILLGGIASISMLVGGIGIMNIMLVTVTERIKEIGIRKAIGAKERDILQQFLIEALIMSASGGVFGILGGLEYQKLLKNLVVLQRLLNLGAFLWLLPFLQL